MAKTQEEMEELVRKHTGAQTHPLGQGPQTDVMPTTPPIPNASPALAPGGNGQASNAPATAQPNGPQAGAGGTSARDAVLNVDPKKAVEAAETSMEAISSKSGQTAKAGPEAEAQKKKINEVLSAQGVEPRKAFEDLYKTELKKLEARHESGEITKKQYKGWKNRWKNIFNTVPEEDFGLFMMDFGLRMMQASGQGETLGASIGMAGQGALAGAQGRQQLKQQQSMQREQQATTRALARAGLEQKQTRDAQVESTTGGLIERGPDGKWRPIIDPQTGKPYEREYAGRGGYRGEKAWLYDWGKRIGKGEEELWEIVNGQMSEGERRDKYEELILKMISDAKYTDDDPVLGKKYRDFTNNDIQAWIEAMMGGRRGALQ